MPAHLCGVAQVTAQQAVHQGCGQEGELRCQERAQHAQQQGPGLLAGQPRQQRGQRTQRLQRGARKRSLQGMGKRPARQLQATRLLRAVEAASTTGGASDLAPSRVPERGAWQPGTAPEPARTPPPGPPAWQSRGRGGRAGSMPNRAEEPGRAPPGACRRCGLWAALQGEHGTGKPGLGV